MPSYEYLIGKSINSFEDKLPRGIDVLRLYFNFKNKKDAEKISNTTEQVKQIYTCAGIPTIHYESIRTKVKRLVELVKSIIETRKSQNKRQVEKELSFFEGIVKLFEVTKNEDILQDVQQNFLADQRSIRRTLVSGINIDPNFSNFASTSVHMENSPQHSTSNEYDEMSDSDVDQTEPIDYDNSPDFVPESAGRRIKLCDASIKELSKCGGSYRVIEKALAIGITAAGGRPNDYAISKSSLCGQINSLRSTAKCENLVDVASSDDKVILHFDGKKFAKINAKHVGIDSRMVVVCHTKARDVALGLPILESTEARSYTDKLIELCDEYNLTGRVVGLVCDTTIVNTGEFGGVCALFEDETETECLNIMCRRHIRELNLGCAMKSALGVIDAPTITIFDQVKDHWTRIKEHGYQYKPCHQSILNAPELRLLYEDAKITLMGHAQSKQIRDDYSELVDLCLKFFGIKTNKSFMVPGSISKARWMAKAIYGFKMYLFRDELDLEEDFEDDLLQFVLFVSIIYCKHWNRCSNVFDAPSNDLLLIAELKEYSNYNELIAIPVLNNFLNHLWYLGEELVVLALFSDKVTDEDKNRMRIKLTSKIYPTRGDNSLRLKDYIEGMQLPDCVSERSRFLFSILEIDLSFMNEDAETWKSNVGFKKAKQFIARLIVTVNDTAERALGKANNIVKNQKARSEARFQNMFLASYS